MHSHATGRDIPRHEHTQALGEGAVLWREEETALAFPRVAVLLQSLALACTEEAITKLGDEARLVGSGSAQ